MLPTVAAVLPAEKGNETLVKWGLLPCCRFSGPLSINMTFLAIFDHLSLRPSGLKGRSRHALAAVKLSHEMRALAVHGRQFARRNKAAAQQALLVFSVKNNDLHGQVLVLAQQQADFRMPGAFLPAQLLPLQTMPPQGIQ